MGPRSRHADQYRLTHILKRPPEADEPIRSETQAWCDQPDSTNHAARMLVSMGRASNRPRGR